MIPGQDLRNRLHDFFIFEEDNVSVLYDRANITLRPITQDTAEKFQNLFAAIHLPDGAHVWEDVAQVIDAYERAPYINLLAGLSSNPTNTSDLAQLQVHPDRYLNKLAINVAGACNLACTYCYANKGFYNQSHSTMLSESDAEHYVRRFAERFDLIDNVQFMGGEPSLAIGTIRCIADTFTKLVAEGKLLSEPKYLMVTNAVRFTPAFIELGCHIGLKLTISLDGPELVHDASRVYQDGSGSYRSVRKNTDLALTKGLTVDFEPTFSRVHLKYGMSLIDLCQWFFDEFGVRYLHAPPMSENRHAKDGLALSNEEKIEQYCAVTEWGIDNLLERGVDLMHDFTARLLKSFERRRRNAQLCPAGNSLLSVSVKGDVTPCWMYTDDAIFDMGSVKESDFLGEKAQTVISLMQCNELHSHPECRACLIQPLCFGCKAGDYHATGNPSKKTNCDYMRAIVATTIIRLFSRPYVPAESSGYFTRPSSGQRIYARLRPFHQGGYKEKW